MSVRRSVALELAGIVAAALLFLATFQVRPPYVDIVLAAVAIALIALSARRSTAFWATRRERASSAARTREAWLWSAAFTFAALGALAAIGTAVTHDMAGAPTPPFAARVRNWHVLIAVAVYLPWALMQQYLFQHYLLVRLLQLLPLSPAVALTATAFASVHFPRWPVMAVVLIAGTVWSVLYARFRSLLPLACSHAILGSALHYWVFGRDLIELWLPFLLF
jgi:membrane protease YdiL (CAAX protease family)